MRIDSIHCHVKNVSRGGGSAANAHSSVAAAAYLSRSRLKDERTGRVHRYTREDTDILHEAILLPEGAPAWARQRGKLWNAVEAAERRKDARVAKAIEVAIVRDLPKREWVPLIEAFAARFTALGIAVDFAIHEDGTNHNPHCHLLLSTRTLTVEGFAPAKLEAMNKKTFLEDVRQAWADTCNAFLVANGIAVRVDHRSLKARGIDRTPTKHRGRERGEAERQREDDRMTREPTAEERERYPHLIERGVWPPESDIPDRDMTPAQREELARYWQDKEQGINRDQTVDREPEQGGAGPTAADTRDHGPSIADGPAPADAPDRAVEPDRAGIFDGDQRFATDQQSRERSEQLIAEERELVQKALQMTRTRREHELLTEARKQSPELAEKVERHLLAERVMQLKAEEQNRRAEALREEIRQGARLQERAQRAAMFDRAIGDARDKTLSELEHNRPVEGPDRETLYAQREIDQAQDRMLDEVERDQPSPEDERLRAEARDQYMNAEEKARYDAAAAQSREQAAAEYEKIVEERVQQMKAERGEAHRDQERREIEREREHER